MADSQIKIQCNQLITEGDLSKARELLLDYLSKNPKDEEAWLLLTLTAQSDQMRNKVLSHAMSKNPNSILLQREVQRLSEDEKPAPVFPKKKKNWGGKILFLCIGFIFGMIACLLPVLFFNVSKKVSIPEINENQVSIEEPITIEGQVSNEEPEEIYSKPLVTPLPTNDDFAITENGFYLYDGNLVKLPEKTDGEPDQIDTVYHTNDSKPTIMVKDDQFDIDELHLLVYTYGIGADGSYSSLGYSLGRVFEGSPAEAAGLMAGDVFTKVNGLNPTKMLEMMEINELLRGYPGEWLEIEFLRGTTTYSTTVQRTYYLGYPYTLTNVGFSVTPKGDYVEITLKSKLEPGYYHFITGTYPSGLPKGGDIRNWLFVVSP